MEEQKILVVDDTIQNIKILKDLLENEGYRIAAANNGNSALKASVSNVAPPDLILLDIMMPGMDGYEVCRRLKDNIKTRDIPIIFITAMNDIHSKTKGFEMGAVDYIPKPFEPAEVLARVRMHLELKNYRDQLEQLVEKRTVELIKTQDVTIYSMATLAETRDPETGGHIMRTQNYIRALAEHLKNNPKFSFFLNGKNIDMLFKSAPLHDIGKIGIPDHILMKPGKLTDEEFQIMKTHTAIGRDSISASINLLGDNSFLQMAMEIAYTHHERWDGTGYPQGLAGWDIPISGRLMAIADVYDALISKRVYKPAMAHEEAVKLISRGKGTHFDPDVYEAFVSIADVFAKIALKYLD